MLSCTAWSEEGRGVVCRGGGGGGGGGGVGGGGSLVATFTQSAT